MSSPTRTPAARRAAADRPSRASDDPRGLTAAPARLRLALVLAVLAATAAAIALPLGILDHAPRPGFASGPLLLALALLPAVISAGLVAADRHLMGARVLVGAALLAPGALLTDLQLLLDSTRVARPELVMPTSLASLAPHLGGWLLIAAHVVTIAAGFCAAGYAGASPGSDYAEAVDDPDRPRSLTAARRLLALSLLAGVVVAVGTMMPALYSHDALLVAVDVVPSTWLVRGGALLIAVVAPIALAMAAGTGNPDVHRGVSLGVLAAVAAVSVPPIAAGVFMAEVGVAPGPVVALIGAVLAVAVAMYPSREEVVSVPTTDDTAGENPDDGEQRMAAVSAAVEYNATTTAAPLGELDRLGAARPPRHEAEITLGGGRLHQAAGLLGVLLGIAAAGSALTVVYTVSSLADPHGAVTTGAPAKLGLAAGVLVGVLGLLMLTGRGTALAVRPAFAVSLGALALPAAVALDDALGITKARDSLQAATVPGAGEDVTFGAAFWLSVLLFAGAGVAAVVAALAGVAERDELDLSDQPDNQILWAPAGLAALAAIGAFALPLVKAPNYPVPDLYSTFTVASAGQLLALLAVLAGVLQAPRARPARAAALFVGAAGVVGVRLLQLPLGSSRVPGATAGLGWWSALLALALLLVSAAVAGTAKPDPRKRR